MYNLKGFVDIKPLASNVPFVTAPIGELSSHSSTYSKDRGIYNSVNDRSISIISFQSKSAVNGDITVPQLIIDKCFEITEWIYSRQKVTQTGQTPGEFLQLLSSQFGVTCNSISCGLMVDDITGHPFPEWISFSYNLYVQEENTIKLWFSDDSFRRQYDQSTIVVVPPFQNIDQFFQPTSTVKLLVQEITYQQSIDAISTARDELPETILTAEMYSWVNPNNPNDKTPTNWTVLIYGAMGNDSDLIKDAIVDYILENSAHTEQEWKVIFPDIFKRTEFLVIPKWHQYSVNNLVLQAGVYSPIVKLKTELAYIKTLASYYPATHVENYLAVTISPYKCLALSIISSHENRDNLFDITQIYPDIMSIASTSNDFNRMTMDTQGFLNKLLAAIILSEALTAYSDIPVGFRRTLRNGILYCTFSYKNIQYLVSSKSTTPQ